MNKKSGSALLSPDKHKTHLTRRLTFAFLSGVTYDLGRKGFISSLEGLGAGARQFSKSKKVYTITFLKDGGVCMRFNPYSPWVRKLKLLASQFIIPFCIFQGIRTVFFPTVLDVLLLIIFISIAICLYLELI
jgi:hypothetical protein